MADETTTASARGAAAGEDATAVDGAPDEVRARLALALDVDDLIPALRLARELRPWFGTMKVGLELYSSAGPEAITTLVDLGVDVFCDLKLHDIPNTVHRAARVVGALGARYLTLHTSGGAPMVRAGVEGFREGAAGVEAPDPIALGVTVLTSEPEATAHTLQQRVEGGAALLRALQQAVGLVGREPPLALEILLEAAGADRDVPGEHRHAFVEDVDVGGLVSDVDQPHHPAHGVGIVELERVVQGEGVDVDDRGLEPDVGQERHLVVHQLALGGHQEDGHLQAVALGIEDLEVELHVVHVEGHVLLGLPADDLAGLGLLHPVHADALDDDVAAPHGGHDLLALDARRGEEPPDGVGHQPRVHDLALDDRVVHDRRVGHLREHRLPAPVVDDHELDEPAPDVEADGRPFPPEKRHEEPALWESATEVGQATLPPAPQFVKL